MKKKRDKNVFLSPTTRTKKYFRGWMLPGAFVPLPTDASYKHAYSPFSPQHPSLWQRFTVCLRYSSIQTRWDIERWLARKLHRCWS